eukprot:symbB.v1.2.031559.t1/scaffold3547.1/size54304/2
MCNTVQVKQESGATSPVEVQLRKMDKIVGKHQRELREARCLVTGWLEENRFPAGDPNGKKGVLFVTFALHEAVKQNNAYITSKLLFFGAEPMMKDTWGKTAFDYAKSRKYEQILQVFENSGRSPTSPSHQLRLSNLERTPPPRGFETFFANVAADPLVQVPNCEAQWLNELGSKRLRGKS